jgi:hypothetical protein
MIPQIGLNRQFESWYDVHLEGYNSPDECCNKLMIFTQETVKNKCW